MSRILKRPMFRKGGSPNKGIMTGLVDRKKYAEDGFVTGVGQKAAELIPDIKNLVAKNTPKTRLPIGRVGAEIALGKPLLQAILEGYGGYTKAEDARTAGIDKTALSLGLTQAMKVPKDSRTSLMKNLEAAGYVKGTPEYERAVKLRTLGEGTVGFSEFQTKANVDKANIAGNYAIGGIDQLTRIAKLDTDVFGIKGSLTGFGKDVATEIEGIYKGSLKSAKDKGGFSAGVYDFLETENPDFSGVQPLENALSIRLARTRNPTGRLLKDMITDAKRDANLTGLGGATKIKQRLPFIFKEFIDTATTQYKAAGKTPEQIAAILNPKIKEFNTAMSNMSDSSGTLKNDASSKIKVPTKNADGVYVF